MTPDKSGISAASRMESSKPINGNAPNGSAPNATGAHSRKGSIMVGGGVDIQRGEVVSCGSSSSVQAILPLALPTSTLPILSYHPLLLYPSRQGRISLEP